MHRSRLGQIVIDCNGDLERAAAFWSAALGHRASTLQDPQDAHYRQLEVEHDRPRILLQRVAQVRTWWVMEAPTGHRFCALHPQRPDFAERGGMRGDR